VLARPRFLSHFAYRFLLRLPRSFLLLSPEFQDVRLRMPFSIDLDELQARGTAFTVMVRCVTVGSAGS
jgi:hypothetical protein